MALEALKQYAQEIMRPTVEDNHTAPSAPAKPAKVVQAGKLDAESQAIVDTYKRQQDAIRRTEQLQHSLIKGLSENAQPIDLLLQAVEIIGLMAGDNVVLNSIAKEYAAKNKERA